VHPAPVTAHDWYLLACVAGTVLLLLLLVGKFKLHAALGLSVAAFALGVAAGMPLNQVPLSFTSGVGNMMGHIAIILGMGAILGQLLASSGGAASLGKTLVEGCGTRGLPWALLGLSLLVGMPVFFEVGLVLLMPIIVEAAERAQRPPILMALPVLAGLSITHGLIPPHPSALLAATVFHADLGRVILWGMLAGTPAAAIAGPGVWYVLERRWLRRQKSGEAVAEPLAPSSVAIGTSAAIGSSEAVSSRPAGTTRALSAILLPIVLIFGGSWADSIATPGSIPNQILRVLGYPDVAMLVAVLVALVTLGGKIPREPQPRRSKQPRQSEQPGQSEQPRQSEHHGPEMLRKLTAESFMPIAGVLMILAAAGGLSGVLRDSGAAQSTVGLALGAHMPPLVLAWALAALVRVCMGSATVGMAVASGVLAPVAGQLGVRPELLVIATGSGSLMLSHVNDSGFWLVGSLFKLDVKETLSTWSVVETVLSTSGLLIALLLSLVLR
jgi:gluconate:H+ symporter, GntP family